MTFDFAKILLKNKIRIKFNNKIIHIYLWKQHTIQKFMRFQSKFSTELKKQDKKIHKIKYRTETNPAFYKEFSVRPNENPGISLPK